MIAQDIVWGIVRRQIDASHPTPEFGAVDALAAIRRDAILAESLLATAEAGDVDRARDCIATIAATCIVALMNDRPVLHTMAAHPEGEGPVRLGDVRGYATARRPLPVGLKEIRVPDITPVDRGGRDNAPGG